MIRRVKKNAHEAVKREPFLCSKCSVEKAVTGEQVWIVTDPTPESEMVDILFPATAIEFIRQVKGGLTEAMNPAFYANEADAKRDASNRLTSAIATKEEDATDIEEYVYDEGSESGDF